MDEAPLEGVEVRVRPNDGGWGGVGKDENCAFSVGAVVGKVCEGGMRSERGWGGGGGGSGCGGLNEEFCIMLVFSYPDRVRSERGRNEEVWRDGYREALLRWRREDGR